MSQDSSISPIMVLQYGMAPENECGGIEAYLYNQFSALDFKRVHYDFIAKRNDFPMSYHREICTAGSQIFGLPHRREHPILHYVCLVRLLLKKHGVYDAFVVNASTVNMATILLVAQMCGIKCRVYHAHTSGNMKRRTGIRRVFDCLNAYILRISATHYFSCSLKAGRWMFGERAEFRVVNNAVRSSRYLYDEMVRQQKREELNLGDAFVVGVVGNYTEPKNYAFIARVFAELLKTVPNSKLLICGREIPGDDTCRKFRDAVQALGISSSVVALGFRTDIPNLMQAFDCLLMPSFFEGLPVAGVEAQFADLPCFFSDTITREVGFSSKVRYLSLDAGAETWADCIVAGRKAVRQKLSICQIAESGFDVAHEAACMMDFYEGACR